jgi:hypothetical protein
MKVMSAQERETFQRRQSPRWQRRGGRDIKKNIAKPPLEERTGWFVQQPIDRLIERTTPSAPNKEASRLFDLWRSHPSFTTEGNDPTASPSARPTNSYYQT